jgi:pyridoxine 4-dehydrogenase
MEKLRKENKIRHIGLSNVSTNHLKKALKYKIPIAWVQIEMHPHFCDFKLLEFCLKHSIGIQAWRPLNLGRISDDAILIEIGHKYKKNCLSSCP